MTSFKYDANLTYSLQSKDYFNFTENSVITQMINLQPMIVTWVDGEKENKAMLSIDFYNEKIYTIFGQEISDSLFADSVKEIIKNKKRNILNFPSPDDLIENSTEMANQLFKAKIPCQND